MAATTITRATITDDSGAGTDGTILNAAWVGTALYDKIDALFATTPVYWEGSSNGERVVGVRNTSNGTAASSLLTLGNDVTDRLLALVARSTGYTPSGLARPSGVELYATGSSGLAIVANHALGAIKFATGGGTERGQFTADGHFVLAEQAANPATGDLAADAAIAVYTKADKLVIAYNNGGTLTYITLDLDGSDTTWAHSTSAP